MSRESPIRICRVQYEKTPWTAQMTISAEQNTASVCGSFGMVVRQQEAQRNLRQPAELRQRSLGALDAIHDGAEDQRQQRSGDSHAGLRQHADDHFAFVPRHVREQAHELRPSGDALVRCLRLPDPAECICRCAHLRMDCGVSSVGTSLRYLS